MRTNSEPSSGGKEGTHESYYKKRENQLSPLLSETYSLLYFTLEVPCLSLTLQMLSRLWQVC